MQTHGDILRDYEAHPEAKCADVHDSECTARTVGLLVRRHVRTDRVVYIGKGSNLREDLGAGVVKDPLRVYVDTPIATR